MDITSATAYINALPIWAIILLMCILPNTPFPGSLVVLLGGCLLAGKFGVPAAIVITLMCLGLAFIWMYGIMYCFHPKQLYSWLCRKFPKLMHLSTKSGWQLVFTVRLIPGCPLFVQTLILGFLKAPVKEYMVGSIVPQCITVPIVIIGGHSAIKHMANPLVGVGIFIAVIGIMLIIGKIKTLLLKKENDKL